MKPPLQAEISQDYFYQKLLTSNSVWPSTADERWGCFWNTVYLPGTVITKWHYYCRYCENRYYKKCFKLLIKLSSCFIARYIGELQLKKNIARSRSLNFARKTYRTVCKNVARFHGRLSIAESSSRFRSHSIHCRFYRKAVQMRNVSPEPYHGYSNTSDSRRVLAQCTHQWMTLCCHGLVPSAADTKVQYARQLAQYRQYIP